MYVIIISILIFGGIMTDIKLPSHSDVSQMNYVDNFQEKKTSTNEENSKSVQESNLPHSIQSKAPEIQTLCDKLFNNIGNKKSDFKLLNERKNIQNNPGKILNELNISIDYENVFQGNGSLENLILERFTQKNISKENFDHEIYQFFRNLKDQGLLTKTNENGEQVELTDEEFNDLVDKAKQFVSKYYELIDKENEFEHDKEEEIHHHQIDYGTTNVIENSRNYKASKVNEKQEQTPKIFFTILLAFTRAQMEMQQEKSKIKKEQMREIADEVRRLSNKLKDLHQEEAHQEIQMANIKNEELKKTASKLSKTNSTLF